MRAVAVNVGANTNEPGFRAPIRPDGDFDFLPIPEIEPTASSVPTYGDLAPHVTCSIPEDLGETPVHLDPTFTEYPYCERYTYGDPYGVKARPIGELDAGDRLYFYATLTVNGPVDHYPAEWGAFLIGHFTLADAPLLGDPIETVPAPLRDNAHCQRREMDAAVLVRGDPAGSRLYDRAVPLSAPSAGVDAGELVTAHSSDSGCGPWWRRPLRFDQSGAAALAESVDYHR